MGATISAVGNLCSCTRSSHENLFGDFFHYLKIYDTKPAEYVAEVDTFIKSRKELNGKIIPVSSSSSDPSKKDEVKAKTKEELIEELTHNFLHKYSSSIAWNSQLKTIAEIYFEECFTEKVGDIKENDFFFMLLGLTKYEKPEEFTENYKKLHNVLYGNEVNTKSLNYLAFKSFYEKFVRFVSQYLINYLGVLTDSISNFEAEMNGVYTNTKIKIYVNNTLPLLHYDKSLEEKSGKLALSLVSKVLEKEIPVDLDSVMTKNPKLFCHYEVRDKLMNMTKEEIAKEDLEKKERFNKAHKSIHEENVKKQSTKN